MFNQLFSEHSIKSLFRVIVFVIILFIVVNLAA